MSERCLCGRGEYYHPWRFCEKYNPVKPVDSEWVERLRVLLIDNCQLQRVGLPPDLQAQWIELENKLRARLPPKRATRDGTWELQLTLRWDPIIIYALCLLWEEL